MLKLYLNQIQFIFCNLVRYYKQNVKTFSPIDTNDFTKIEKITNTKLSSDLLEFLNWSCVNPIWGAPFIPFDDKGKNFEVWSHRPEIIVIKLESNLYGKKFEFMGGEYILNGEVYLFKVCLDYDATQTGTLNSIFVLSGKQDKVYSTIFEDTNNIKVTLLSANITQFTEKYLKYLKSLPINIKVSKKIDSLLNDPKKLFKFVKNYNFDEGEEKIEQIVNDKRCDVATALLIYWLSQPYLIDEKVGIELNMIPIAIEKNINKNFYARSENHFNPKQNEITDFIQEYNLTKNKLRSVPKFMLNFSV